MSAGGSVVVVFLLSLLHLSARFTAFFKVPFGNLRVSEETFFFQTHGHFSAVIHGLGLIYNIEIRFPPSVGRPSVTL